MIDREFEYNKNRITEKKVLFYKENKNNMSRYILPDYAYAKGTLPTMETIRKHESFDINWLPHNEIMAQAQHTAKATTDRMTFTDDVGNPFYDEANGLAVKPGMLPAAEGSAFLAERTYSSVFHQKCDQQKIPSKKTTIVFMDADSNLQSLTSLEDGKQIGNLNERTQNGKRTRKKVLIAEPYIEFSEFTYTFVEDNLVGQRFLQEYVNAVNRKRDFNMGQLDLYAIRDSNAANADGLHANDGFLKQLEEVHDYYSQNIDDVDSQLYGQGYYCGIHGTGTDKVPIDFSADTTQPGNAVDQLSDMETQYLTQEGTVGYEFLVSHEAYGQLRKIARNRETPGGDALYFDGGKLQLNGVPITPCQELGRPLNGYKQHILLGNFRSACMVGNREDFVSHMEWNQDRQRWVIDTKVYFGNLIKYEQDILAAEVTGLPSQLASGGNASP